MSTAVLDEPPTALPDGYPFHIGYRYARSVDESGKKTSVKVPLTEEDFLHPQEEDRFMVTLGHTEAIWHLGHALTYGGRSKPATGLFAELRIDWQVPGVKPHGPDVIVFDRDPAGLASDTGTLLVRDLGLKPLVLFEVTSPETRHVDLDSKFDEYLLVRVPVYIVFDLASPDGEPHLIGFELDGDNYREMDPDPKLGLFVPALGLWFRLTDAGAVIVADAVGKDIPGLRELGLTLDAALAEAKAEKARADAAAETATAAIRRADAAQQRADAAVQSADTAVQIAETAKKIAEAEKARADALERELAELKARLASNG